MSMYQPQSQPMLSIDQRRAMLKRLEKMERRMREQTGFIYDQFKDMSEDNLKGLLLMFTSILSPDDAEGVEKQVTYFQGMVAGILASRSDDGYVIDVGDVFPHYNEEDKNDIAEALDSSEGSSPRLGGLPKGSYL